MHSDQFDVIVIGGAFSGAATALLLRRDHPALRVLVVEKAEEFDSKVGEATTEMAAMFLTRRLRLWQHLERNHLPKEGLRYWFSNEHVHSHEEASEAGAFLRSAVPSFQLRRDVLDEHILALAADEGAAVLRPARVSGIELGTFDQQITVEESGRQRRYRSRWVVDASGRGCFLGRTLGIIDWNEEHPVGAVWGRWRGVRNIDDIAAGSSLGSRNIGSRRLATNHYMGFGFWIWVIPLQSGETSIGIVFDKRIHRLHEARRREQEYVAFLRSIRPLGELISGAELRCDDLRSYSFLPYLTRQYMGKGWALVGDSAAFLDPYYSPGLDHAAFSVEATVRIIGSEAMGDDVTERIRVHNETFLRSYRRFFRAAYADKYFYMGEADLLTSAFLLDTAHYYIFVVMPAYRIFKRFHWMPVLGPKGAFLSYGLMRLYNRRLARIARLRRQTGEAGRRNNGRRIKAYFDLDVAPFRMAVRGLRYWLLAELDALRLRAKPIRRQEERPLHPVSERHGEVC